MELQIFNNPEFGKIRTIEEENKVLFCGKDVAKALGYANTQDALNRHCREVVKRDLIDALGRKQEASFIPEDDIYCLAAKSELPGADAFESWIFNEVLPTIRRNGAYMTPLLYHGCGGKSRKEGTPMNEIKTFTWQPNITIRTVERDGDPWFVLKDVCEALDIGSPHKVADRLDEDERNQIPLTDALGRQQPTTIVSEAGLYNVILRSDKPAAQDFRRWVTHEVLPSIRRNGAYMTPETLEAAILNPDYLLRVVTALKDETDKRKELEAANATLTVDLEIARPKAEYFDELVDRNLLTNFRETAKQLGVKEKAFVAFLLDHRYIYRDKRGRLMPYAEKNNGLFEIKETYNEKTQWSGTQTLITPRGRETFRLLHL